MHKEKQSINNIAVIATLVVLAVLGLTYWQIIRPYTVTKSCHRIALDNAGYNQDSWRSWAGDQHNQANYMFVYEMCMQKEGINQ